MLLREDWEKPELDSGPPTWLVILPFINSFLSRFLVLGIIFSRNLGIGRSSCNAIRARGSSCLGVGSDSSSAAPTWLPSLLWGPAPNIRYYILVRVLYYEH